MPRTGLQMMCFDFDGTLVDSAGVEARPIDPELIGKIEALRKRGVVWVINTGRTLEQLRHGLRAAGIDSWPDYIIAEETSLLEPCSRRGWTPLGTWNGRRDDAFRELLRNNPGFFEEIRAFVKVETAASYIRRPESLDEIIASNEAEMDQICHRIEAMRRRHSGELGFQRNTIYLRFGHRDFHKGSTLATLARHLRVPRHAVFAAGDNLNDLPMLRPDVAAFLACPANSHREVIETVGKHDGYVATRPTGPGILEALRFFGF